MDGRKRNPAGPAFNQRKLKKPDSGINGLDYAGNFADFLAARPKGSPFFFWYGATEPHRSFARGAGWAAAKNSLMPRRRRFCRTPPRSARIFSIIAWKSSGSTASWGKCCSNSKPPANWRTPW